MTEARIQPLTARERLESYTSLQYRMDRLTRELSQARRYIKETQQPVRWQIRARHLQDDIRQTNTLLFRRKKELEALLSRLPREEERQVLALRYLGLYSYDDISQTMAYSERHIYRLHLQGIQQLDSILQAAETIKRQPDG